MKTSHTRSVTSLTLMETFESRRFFSVVNVASFGINPSDATGAIQAAFKASHDGDTILFPAGTYRLSRTMTIPGNRTVQGNGAVLVSPARSYAFQNDRTGNPNNVKVSGFEVQGRFMRIEAWAGWSSNIEIANNRFDPANFYTDGSTEHESIFISNGARNVNIHNNTADGTWGDGWILAFGFQNVSITDNIIKNMNEGIHYLGQYAPSNGLTIARNIFQNNHRMNIEVQGAGANVLVEQNLLQGANVSSNFNQNMETFGFSLAGDGMSNTIVRRNKIVSYDRADGTGLRQAIELAGFNCAAYQNDIEGTNASVVLNTSTNGQVYDNRIVGARALPTAYGGRSPGASLRNNGANVSLDWNWSSFSLPNAGASGSAPTSNYSPTPTPTPTPTSTSTSTGSWTVINGQAALNGKVDAGTRGVVSVFQSNGQWYQLNTANQVWTLPGANSQNVTGKVTPPSSGSSTSTSSSSATFSGSAITLNAEDFTSATPGGSYRNSPVVLEHTSDVGGGYDIGKVRAGEWFNYNVNVPTAGSYTLGIRFASGGVGGTVHFELDGKNVTGPISLTGTGGWQSWKTFTKTGVALPAGTHTLRLVVDSSSGDIGNFNWVSVTKS